MLPIPAAHGSRPTGCRIIGGRVGRSTSAHRAAPAPYSGELGAGHAYRGHWRSLRDPEERAYIFEHAARQALLKQLGEENSAGIAPMALSPPAATA